MRFVVSHPQLGSLPDFKAKPEALTKLKSWLMIEVENAYSARGPQEALWREMMRMYEGVPKNPVKNTPVENAPNIEVTLGAIACDSVYAQILDLIFNISPTVTCRATQPKYAQSVKSLQTFVDHLINSDINMRGASEHAFLDDVQLGSAFYYVPWVDTITKSDINRVITKGPRIFSVPAEDIIIQGGAYDDLQIAKLFGMRQWLMKADLEKMSKFRGWNIDGVIPAAYKDATRTRRETLGRTSTPITQRGHLYEICDLYVHYDIDDDGEDEDLLIVWDRTSRNILHIRYNPYDNRPFEKMCYQLRSHLFYGMGVMEMIRPYQEEMTELHNAQTTNVMLANCRLWKARSGAIPDGQLVIWPNRLIELPNPEDLMPEVMADVHPSIFQAQASVVSLAERRVGINDLSTPRPSAVLGSRTPGITALSMLQQVNRRFTPAFDQARLATAGAVRQCLYRYAERLLDGRFADETASFILDQIGQEDGQNVVTLLKDPRFSHAIAVELTASSASINRDADRQNAMMLVQFLGTYYEKVLQLMSIISNPQTPPAISAVAKKIAEAAGEAIERTIRTFDQVRDPHTFIVDFNNEIDQVEGDKESMNGLAQLMQGMQGGQSADPSQIPIATGTQA